jgi:F-type H+-transporting ATPase subunit gamma
MANLKELRGRIKSVTGIAQITRAMEMVASMKLRKVQAKALSFHPYTEELRAMIERRTRTAFNANNFKVLRSIMDEVKAQDPDRKVKFWAYGRKGYTYLTRRGFEVERFFVEPPLDKLEFQAAKMVVDELTRAFLAGTVDNIRIAYTRFASASRFEPTNARFLPVMNRDFITVEQNREAQEAAAKEPTLDWLIEPDPRTLHDLLVPRYLETVVYDAMLQSVASEHASRRMAMKSATDAASRMIKQLKKKYNRARQENITKELLDIIGGASAVQ